MTRKDPQTLLVTLGLLISLLQLADVALTKKAQEELLQFHEVNPFFEEAVEQAQWELPILGKIIALGLLWIGIFTFGRDKTQAELFSKLLLSIAALYVLVLVANVITFLGASKA